MDNKHSAKEIIENSEKQQRVMELSPANTLRKIGFTSGMSFCDIGAGIGLFTFPAAEISRESIYAVDILPEMREILRRTRDNSLTTREVLREKVQVDCENNLITDFADKKYENVIIKSSINEVPDFSIDIALLCTVVHALDDITEMAEQVRRILTDTGIIAIIEFHKKETDYGPPVVRRISQEDLIVEFSPHGFRIHDSFILGNNFYCATFQKCEDMTSDEQDR